MTIGREAKVADHWWCLPNNKRVVGTDYTIMEVCIVQENGTVWGKLPGQAEMFNSPEDVTLVKRIVEPPKTLRI